MEPTIARHRYTRRPVSSRRNRKAPGSGSNLRLIIMRQLIICALLLVIVGIAKSINLTATNFVTNQIKYALSYNIELKSVFSYFDKLAADVRGKIMPSGAGKQSATGNTAVPDNGHTNSTAPGPDSTAPSDIKPSSGITPDAGTPQSSAAAMSAGTAGEDKITGGNTASLSSEETDPGTVAASSSIEDKSNDVGYTGADTVKPESSVLAASSGNFQPAEDGMLTPVEGTVGSLFGDRSDEITGIVKIHKGIDISVKKSENVLAVLDGKISETGSSPDYGSYIRIKHADGLQTVYANCSGLLVQKDDVVKRGEVIAKIGGAGNSAGIHLHFEVWKDGAAVDPLEYISVPVR